MEFGIMKKMLLLIALFSPFVVAKTLQLASPTASLTVDMGDKTSAPIKFDVIGNGPGMNDMPSVCEISGEAKFWVGTDFGSSWMYLSPDKKTMVILKGRTDGKWTVMGFVPDGPCGMGSENSLDGVYDHNK
jgi:hypothetical protein